MNEKEFRKRLRERLQRELGDEIELRDGRRVRVKVEMNKNLIYKVVVLPSLNNENFERQKIVFEPNNPREPRRGKYAFQTDLLIVREDDLPLVAIEIKYRSPNTHHILTYSTKAQEHKKIYPYLRYGLVIGGENRIPNRFFTHNIGFDFAYALNSVDDNIGDLVDIIKKQIESANLLLQVLRRENQVKKFSTIVELNESGR